MDIIRFFLAWFVITFVWVMLNTCPDCGQHHLGHDNIAPVVVGFLGAGFFHFIRIKGRKSPIAEPKEPDNKD